MRWLMCAAVCVCLAGTVLADTQFWVVVGSYRDLGNAEKTLGRANATLAESFSIAAAEVGTDRWYRVVAGPYSGRVEAEAGVIDAHQAGFADAWKLAASALDLSIPGSEGGDGTFAGYDYDYEDEDEYGEFASLDDYPDIDSLLSPVEPIDTIDAEPVEVRPVHDLVDEAPEGYGLHKLQRDG